MPDKPGDGYYTWQFYLRAAVLKAVYLRYIATEFWYRFAKAYRERPFQLAGVEQASVPIITALILSGPPSLNAFTIRKEFKSYGIGNIVEGKPSDLPVLFVDDLTSPTHDTFWHAVRVIKRERLKLYPRAFVLVRKQNKSISPMIDTSVGPVHVESLYTLDEFRL